LCTCVLCAGVPPVQMCVCLPPSQPQMTTSTPTTCPPGPSLRPRCSSATSSLTPLPPPSPTPGWPRSTVGSLKVRVVRINVARPCILDIFKRHFITSSAHCLLLPAAIPLLGKGEEEPQLPPSKKSKGVAKTKEEHEVQAALQRIETLTTPLEVPWCRCSTVWSPPYTCGDLGTGQT
jgi:hypothetical protein